MTHIRFRAQAAAMVLAGTAAMNSAFAVGAKSTGSIGETAPLSSNPVFTDR